MNKQISRAAGLLAAAAGTGWLLWGNRAIETSEYEISSPQLPEAFHGFRIAHISDFHNTRFGPNHRLLLNKLREARPHIIAITGDMIDARRTDIDCALEFAEQAVKIAPCYYVMGNHEARIPAYPAFEHGLRKRGVQVLRNQTLQLTLQDAHISLMGMDDPTIMEDFPGALRRLRESAEGFTVLLIHHPEYFDVYCQNNIDLILCGHAHGGQVRIPFVGGVIAPHQGFFPKYDGGVYSRNNTAMVLSRGLGNSLCPLRVNNRPELVVIELHKKIL